MERLISAGGLLTMILLAWLMSSRRNAFPVRTVLGGLLLQFALASLLLPRGGTGQAQSLVGDVSEGTRWLLDHVDHGSSFVFGSDFREHFIAFKVLPTIIFFSALMSVLIHLGLIQRVVESMGWLMSRSLGTTGPESLAAAANVFFGQTEAPLMVRPFLRGMSNSELTSVMVGGYATMAGGMLAAYAAMGIDAGHLLTASLISAPAALLIAKVLEPEDPEHAERQATAEESTPDPDPPTENILDALASGTTIGLKLALNVGAMLITFLALIAVLDSFLALAGKPFGQVWSLSGALGYGFAPLAWLIGVQASETMHVGELIGLRMAANEFIAYEKLSEWLQPDSPVKLSSRAQILATYALCGFANLGSIGIQIGGLGALVPERRKDIVRLSFRAMLGGTLACLMTACVAGIML